MSERHYSEDVMLAYLDDDGEGADLPSMRAHVLHCETCTDHVNELRGFVSLLKDARSWQFAADISSSAVEELAHGIAEDEETAQSFVEALDRHDVSSWPDIIASRLATRGLVYFTPALRQIR